MTSSAEVTVIGFMAVILLLLRCLHVVHVGIEIKHAVTYRSRLTTSPGWSARTPRLTAFRASDRRHARPSARAVLRGNPRPHAGARGRRLEEARHRSAGRGRAPLSGGPGSRRPAAPPARP